MSARIKPELTPVISSAAAPQREFLRFEFKYILNQPLRDAIEGELGHFLQPDPVVVDKPERKYVVRSLYFDDPSYSCYYDKIDGLTHRAKFRLRTYTNDPQEACDAFLEIKGRHNQKVFKKRVPMLPGEDGLFTRHESDITRKLLRQAEPGHVRDRFHYDYLRKSIRPVMLIDYLRRPYVSRFSPDFRLTFDDNLHGMHTDNLYPDDRSRRRALLRGYTVMEVKFSSQIPPWFHRIIRSYQLKRVSVSKVCKGIDAWNLVPRLD
ncbi:MAG: polyphosphate polymerase domain-containing protein [Gammaproteobacteria bacterium]|nr:polyphosphate polymerase domain-containing protein [Gammaproteobacteria bacterium]